MLTQASIEALRTRFDASGIGGDETVYASRHENDVAFVAIAPDGKFTMFKSDGYPDALLEDEIMSLCCAKYDDRTVHAAQELNEEKNTGGSSDGRRAVLIELIVISIALILIASFLLIYWLLFKDFEKTLVIGGIIYLPVVLFIFPQISAMIKRSGK